MTEDQHVPDSRSQQKRRQHGRFPWPVPIALGALALLAIVLFGALLRSVGSPTRRDARELPSGSYAIKGPTVPIEVNGRPSIKVDKQQVGLGDVRIETTVAVSFQVMNVGDSALTITEPPYVEVVEGC